MRTLALLGCFCLALTLVIGTIGCTTNAKPSDKMESKNGKMETKMETKMDGKMETKMNGKMETKMDGKMETKDGK